MSATAPEHPKIFGLSDAAFRWWFNAMCWCKRNEVDGLVPEVIARGALYRGDDDVTTAILDELTASTLLETRDDGSYVLHGWTDWQTPVAEIEAIREKKRLAGRKGGQAKARNRLTTSHSATDSAQVLSDTSTNALAPASPSGKPLGSTCLPNPRRAGVALSTQSESESESESAQQVSSEIKALSPEGGVGGDEPSESAKPRSKRQSVDRLETDFDEIWAIYPRKTDRLAALKAYKARRRERVPAEDLATATANYAKVRNGQDPQFTKRGATFFGPSHPWRDYLPGAPGLIEASQSEVTDKDHVSEASQAWRAYRRFIADQSVYEFCEFPDDRMKFAAYETYGNWREMCECAGRERNEDKAVFVKAWNEFEGANV